MADKGWGWWQSVFDGLMVRHTNLGYNMTLGHQFVTKPFVSNNQRHTHNFRSSWPGTADDPHNPEDFGPRSFFISGRSYEKHVFTARRLSQLPPGFPHCPLEVTRVDRPIVQIEIMLVVRAVPGSHSSKGIKERNTSLVFRKHSRDSITVSCRGEPMGSDDEDPSPESQIIQTVAVWQSMKRKGVFKCPFRISNRWRLFPYLAPEVHRETAQRPFRILQSDTGNSAPLFDLDYRFRIMENYPQVVQVLTVGRCRLWRRLPIPSRRSTWPGWRMMRWPNSWWNTGRSLWPPSRFCHEQRRSRSQRDWSRINDLGFRGIYVHSNINGKPLDSPEFLPFFEKCPVTTSPSTSTLGAQTTLPTMRLRRCPSST